MLVDSRDFQRSMEEASGQDLRGLLTKPYTSEIFTILFCAMSLADLLVIRCVNYSQRY